VGTRVTLGHQFDRFWSVSGSLRLEGVNISNVPFFAPRDYQDVVGDSLIVGPRLALTRDSRDSFIRPTEGSFFEASVEQVLGSFTFPIVNVEYSKYFTTYQRQDGSGKHVLMARTQVAWAGDDAPVFERFYAGGFRTLRGFAFRGVGPLENGFRVGGNFMWVNTLEYQVPIKANDRLYAVAFVDSGTVERNVEINDYRISAGVGLRLQVPGMGPVPIALDFAFPINRARTDDEQIFSFYVGISR
jgi:outer membrane protein insertion porin family